VAAARSIRAGASAVAVIVLIIAALALVKALHVQFPTPGSSSCLVRGDKFDVPLDSAQAGIAATIAGVATHRSMPVRAVAIAYAAALQESDLQNLSYGDRDSVGVFQQRPSEGWGSRRQLLNPVYASTRFFAALAAVPRYRRLPIYRAAQEVQHSADGRAYSQYAPQGAAMASGFSGRRPHAVWCWYGAPIRGRSRLTAAEAELRTTFGRLAIRHVGDPLAEVKVRTVAAGWAVAAWLVSHANRFKLRHVSYLGYHWTAAHGRKGWTSVPRTARRTAAHQGVTFG
jgi:hypothetical protein